MVQANSLLHFDLICFLHSSTGISHRPLNTYLLEAKVLPLTSR